MTPRIFFTLKFLAVFSILAGVLAIFTLLTGLTPRQIWPLFIGCAGMSGFYTGVRKRNRFSADFVIPSIIFLFLSGFFSLFSFGLMGMRLKEFVVRNWAGVIVASAALLTLLVTASKEYRKRGDRKKDRPDAFKA